MSDRPDRPDDTNDRPSPVLRHRAGTGATRSVTVTRTYPATLDQLWDTCTQPDLLARWFGSITGDTSPAGTVRLGDDATCEILRCERPHRLDVTWQAYGETNVVTLRLASAPSGTTLTLEHLGIVDTRLLDYGPGWDAQLDRLADVVAESGSPEHDVARPVLDKALWTDLDEEPDVRWGSTDHAGVVTFRRALRSPRAAVWSAVTTPTGLSEWFGTTTGDLRADGDWSVDFGGGTAVGTVKDCRPGFSFTTTYRQGIDPLDAVHTVEVALADVDDTAGGTRLILVHTFPAGATEHLRQGMSAGWSAFLWALDGWLTGRSRDELEADWMVDFRIAAIALGSGAAA